MTPYNPKVLEVYKEGLETFKSPSHFHHWLNDEIPALGGKKPIDLLKNDEDIDMVLAVLGRIQHGIIG